MVLFYYLAEIRNKTILQAGQWTTDKVSESMVFRYDGE